MAREVGASAGRIAERVAELLGYQIWGKALTQRISQKLGVSHAEAAELDERTTGLFDGLRSGVFRAQSLSGAAYRRALSAVVDEVCTRGEAVLLGRGAALLARPEQALRVRIVAPRALRVQRHASRFGLPLGEAERRVLRADREQLRFGQLRPRAVHGRARCGGGSARDRSLLPRTLPDGVGEACDAKAASAAHRRSTAVTAAKGFDRALSPS
jgi:cytidylate kinase